jgi:SAM-dependent methyltransferase
MKELGANNQDFRILPGLWPDIRTLPVLDMGCGSGLYTREMARRGADAVGVDLDIHLLRRAREQEGGGRCWWVCADARHLPFREGVFAMVVCVEVLTHVDPQTRCSAFAEAARVLGAEGASFFSLHNRLRLTLASWLRLRRSVKEYKTTNLSVWPTTPDEARSMLSRFSLRPQSHLHYVNYHSRFTHDFNIRYPFLARFVIACEGLLSRLPLVRRLAITFIITANRTGDIKRYSS